MAAKKFKVQGVDAIFIEEATTSNAGLMSAADKTLLDSLSGGDDPFKFSTWAQTHPSTSDNAGDITFGLQVQSSVSATATGITTYWAGGAATLRARMWSSGGVSLATGTLVVTGPGLYTITFAASAAMSASVSYWFTVYETSGTRYTSVSTSEVPTLPFFLKLASPSLMILGNGYSNGDAFPVNALTNQWNVVAPVYTT